MIISTRMCLACAAVLLLAVPGLGQDYVASYTAGIKAMEKDQYEEAIRNFSAVIAIDREPGKCHVIGTRSVCYSPYYWLTLAHYRLGDCDEAIKTWGQTNRESLSRSVGADWYDPYNQAKKSCNRRMRVKELRAEIQPKLKIAHDRAGLVAAHRDGPWLRQIWDSEPTLGAAQSAADRILSEADSTYDGGPEGDDQQQAFDLLKRVVDLAEQATAAYDKINDAVPELTANLYRGRLEQARAIVAAARAMLNAAEKWRASPDLVGTWDSDPRLGRTVRRARELLDDTDRKLNDFPPAPPEAGSEQALALFDAAVRSGEQAHDLAETARDTARSLIDSIQGEREEDIRDALALLERAQRLSDEVVGLAAEPELDRSWERLPELGRSQQEADQQLADAEGLFSRISPSGNALDDQGWASQASESANRAIAAHGTVREAARGRILEVRVEASRELDDSIQRAEEGITELEQQWPVVTAVASQWDRNPDLGPKAAEAARFLIEAQEKQGRVSPSLDAADDYSLLVGAQGLASSALEGVRRVNSRARAIRDGAIDDRLRELERTRGRIDELLRAADDHARNVSRLSSESLLVEDWSTDDGLGPAEQTARQRLRSARSRRDAAGNSLSKLQDAESEALRAREEFAIVKTYAERLLKKRRDAVGGTDPVIRVIVWKDLPGKLGQAWGAYDAYDYQGALDLLDQDYENPDLELARAVLMGFVHWNLSREGISPEEEAAAERQARRAVLRSINLNDTYTPDATLGEFVIFYEDIRRGLARR